MKVSVTSTVMFVLLPIIGSGVAIADTTLAQTIVPTNATTQVNVSENDVLDISGGTPAAGNLFHSFDQFNIEQQHTANFIATPTTDSIIGQIIGGTASTIDGLLQVTGSSADLYLVNPAGLIFGPNARLDLGGSFTATTATHLGDGTQWFEVLSDPDYSNLVTPPNHFGFSRPGTITNQGQLTVPNGHSIRLLATQINNTGKLSATNGEVTLLAADAGQTFQLGQTGGLLSLEVAANSDLSDTLPALITGGEAHHSNALVINNNGEVSLMQTPANDPQPSFNLTNAGNISTQGTTGGEINLLGNSIQVINSTLNASGSHDGGVIRIGGDYQGQGPLPHASQIDIANTTHLIADAAQGNGGQVIVWSDGTTIFDGNISAQSATGDGGLIETSGLNQLTIGENAIVTTAAPQGAAGLWLLDPTDLTIVETGGLGAIGEGINNSDSTINASTIVAALMSSDVTLQATDTITITAAIDASETSSNRNLVLDTATLNLNDRITLHDSGQLSGTAPTVNVGINGSIQNGVDAVADGGTVNLAAATYREGDPITLDHPLTLIGQGQDNTIISGDADNNGTGDHQVLRITNRGDNITLTDLTIQDGLSTSDGAGLKNDGDNVLISNTNFFNNQVTSGGRDGGAIHNHGSLTLLNTKFQNNSTGSDGGAIDIEKGSVDIINNSFISNQAGRHGGAIDLDPNGSLMVSNTSFTLNDASTDGGAIYLEGDTTLTAVTLLNNTANNGGAIYSNKSGTLNIANSTLSNNQATNLGGAISIFSSGSVNIQTSVIEYNEATISGGGIHNNNNNNIYISDTSILFNQALTELGGGINNLGDLTLTNIDLESNTSNFLGGGIFNGASSLLSVTDSDFRSNQATDDGGGLYNNRGELIISNSGFENNTANRGGGLFNSGTATLDTVNFEANQANIDGGGFYNQINATSEITAGIFDNNSAQNGGGIYNRGDISLLNNVIFDNQAIGLGTQNGGAGIFNSSGGSLSVNSSLIANNTSTTQGGGILNLARDNQTTVTITNSTIINNQALTKGGGIENASLQGFSNLAELTITNSTISRNQASTGGGIRTVGLTILTNTTIAENVATSSGGGLSEHPITVETPELINTIVANNSAPINPDVEGTFNDQGNNLIGIDQGSTGFNLSTLIGTVSDPLNPNLTPLNHNLGTLPSHQLLSNSPAANAGNNSAATASDQNGQPRIIGGTVDIGAIESDILPNNTTITPNDINDPEPQPDLAEPSEPQTPQTPGIENPEPQAPTEPSEPISQTPEIENPEPQAPTIRPVPSDPQQPQTLESSPSLLQQHQSENLTDTSPVTLNGGSILSQEEKSVQSLNPEQNSPASTNGRLQYFDEEAFQYLEESLSKDYEEYWQLPPTQPVTLTSVQQTLNQANQEYHTETAIIYAVFVPQASANAHSLDRLDLPRSQHTPSPEDQLLLILIPANGTPVQQQVNVTRAELTQQATLFRLAVSDPEDSLSYKALARQMHSWLLAPLQKELAEQQVNHVMYSLDQGLRTIPLAAMMQEDTFVIEQYGVSLIPSMGLTQLQVGNIDSQPEPLIAGADQFKTLAALPAVPIELNVVAQSFQSSDVLLNEIFTLDNVLQMQTSQKSNWLHLATHAEFNAGDLDQSFIQFWDSQLTFNQMRELNWQDLELLILSACNTALSSPEAELGFTGIAAAAGIKTSMGSLWDVSDVGTLALIAEFYGQLPKMPLHFNALQQAQISLIRGETQINNNVLHTSHGHTTLPDHWNFQATAEFSHPFYWAGFTMVGNPWK
ncbi:MAG: CHAT domain-containing protein [Cyanobacteria bacterium P01_F01_bin.13]